MRLNDVIKIFNVAIYTSQIKHAGYGTLTSVYIYLLQPGKLETMQMLALLQYRPGPDTIQHNTDTVWAVGTKIYIHDFVIIRY